jgi:hypothetical protein
LNTITARGTQPDIFGFEWHHAELSLVDDAANRKIPYPVPGAHSIAFAALIAEFISVSACFFDTIDYYFKGFQGESVHYLLFASSFAFEVLFFLRHSGNGIDYLLQTIFINHRFQS